MRVIEATFIDCIIIMSSTPPAKRYRTDTTDDDNTNIAAAAAAAAVINSTDNKDTNDTNTIDDNDVISTSKILQQITTLTNDYRIAKPFPHGIINNFCTDGLLGELYVVCCGYHRVTCF